MKNQLDPSMRLRPKGEGWVWFTGMGLSLGLLMIFFLLAYIFWNGVTVFWPKPVAKVVLKSDSAVDFQGKKSFTGVVVKERAVAASMIRGNKDYSDNVAREWQFFVGNKDAYGFMYQYFPSESIATMTYPKNIMVAERLSWGDSLFYPLSLESNNGNSILSGDPLFYETLKKKIYEAQKRREAFTRIERIEIGAINQKIENIRLKKRFMGNEFGEEASKSPEWLAMDRKKNSLEEAYQTLASRAKLLRKQQQDTILHYQLESGETRSQPIGEITYAMYPNQLSFLEKIIFFMKQFIQFLTDNPREANTEGGIFPAIFGTVVMTVLMSIAVMPFGVCAAIYLREYAKQGFLVNAVRIAVNNMAGVPSIVYGVFGLGFFVYFVGSGVDQLFFSDRLPTPTYGTGGVMWASLTLALMTVPVVIVASEEALASVPRGMREASLACGASKWQTVRSVVLPAAAPGILTGLILAMARGAGEVAPLMIVGVVKFAPSLPLDTIFPFFHLERKFMHLGFHIYDLGFQSPDSEAAKPMVFATTFLLIFLVLVLNLLAISIRNHLRRKYSSSTF